MKETSFSSIALKTTLLHTVTYFIVGLVSFTLLDYSARYADPAVANVMRQTDQTKADLEACLRVHHHSPPFEPSNVAH